VVDQEGSRGPRRRQGLKLKFTNEAGDDQVPLPAQKLREVEGRLNHCFPPFDRVPFDRVSRGSCPSSGAPSADSLLRRAAQKQAEITPRGIERVREQKPDDCGTIDFQASGPKPIGAFFHALDQILGEAK
jgi:hypothetical protein